MKKLVVLLFVLISSMSNAQQSNSIRHKFEIDQDSMRIYMLEAINEFRKNRGIPLLSYDSALNAGALNHSLYMVDRGELTHFETDTTSPYFTGYGPATRTGRSVCAENCATSYRATNESMKDLAYELVELWKTSPGHNRNMRSGHKFGFGIAVVIPPPGEDWLTGYVVMATQVFK